MSSSLNSLSDSLPKHIAIIMDGNGRWAESRGLVRFWGHRAGASNLRRIATHCSKKGIEVLTVYAFSAENWGRPEREVRLLMQLLKIYAVRERPTFMKNNIQLRAIGDISKIPEGPRRVLEESILLTQNNTGMVLQLALNYGSRDELVRATKEVAEKVSRGEILIDDINERLVSQHLDTASVPDPDLLIRTGGELRISNYLLWQAAYAEFYFTETFWPHFSPLELDRAIEDFGRRERRFGKILSSTKVAR